MSGGKPLPSAADVEEDDGSDSDQDEAARIMRGEVEEPAAEPEPEPAPRPARPPPPAFKFSTFLYVFLGLLGLWMLIDTSARNSIACALGMVNPGCPSGTQPWGLYWLIGFNSNYLLLTMALAGAIEMLVTSLAYNYTTNWVKAAKVQKWSSAFRKVQMEAIRSGKKNRIAALKPHQERLTRLSGEVSIAQFKGMAITYFLLILIYTWVGLVIAGAPSVHPYSNPTLVALGTGSTIDLMGHVGGLPIPWWFIIFSLYTVPFSLVFRRILKHFWLRRYEAQNRSPPPPASEAAGRSA